MRKLFFVIPKSFGGRKIVHFLREAAACSASQVKRLKLWEDGILLNGVHARTIDRLCPGDRLCVTLREDAVPKASVAGGFAEILYEDEDVLVFNKPADMPCHQSRNHQTGTLANAFAALCVRRGQQMPFRCVNRLDRNTTGAVAAAKSAYAAARLAGQLEKVYLAAVSGVPSPLNGCVDAPVLRPDPHNIRRAVGDGGQRALTRYQTLGVFETEGEKGKCSLIRCTLPTGRTHQIRVHMAHLGCPLLGDDLYGGSTVSIRRQALHCARVAFSSPVTGAAVIVDAPVPQDMQNFIDKVNQSW